MMQRTGGWLLFLLFLLFPAVAGAQEEAAEGDGEDPLIVVIRPTPRIEGPGYYEDRILPTLLGRGFRYTGWYVPLDQLSWRPDPLGLRTPEAKHWEQPVDLTSRVRASAAPGLVLGSAYRRYSLNRLKAMFDIELPSGFGFSTGHNPNYAADVPNRMLAGPEATLPVVGETGWGRSFDEPVDPWDAGKK